MTSLILANLSDVGKGDIAKTRSRLEVGAGIVLQALLVESVFQVFYTNTLLQFYRIKSERTNPRSKQS